MMHTERRALAGIVTLLAVVGMVITLLSMHVNHVFVNANNFANNATKVVKSESVDRLMVDRVTDKVIPDSALVDGLRPQITTYVQKIISSGPVTDAVKYTANQFHSELMSGNANQLTLSLPVGSALASHLRSVSALLADEVGQVGDVQIFQVQIPSNAATVIHVTARFGQDASQLLILTIALIVLALVITPDRRRTLGRLGFGAVLGGLVVVALYFVGRTLLTHQISGNDAQTAVRAIWNTYLGGLVTSGLVMAGCGALVAVVATISRSLPPYGRPRL